MILSKFRLFVLCFSFISLAFQTQSSQKIDSLFKLLKYTKNDHTRYKIYIELGNHFKNSNTDSAMFFYGAAESVSQKIPDIQGKLLHADVTHLKGWCYYLKSDYTAAINHFEKAIEMTENFIQHEDPVIRNQAFTVKAKSLGDLGSMYFLKNDLSRALEFYFLSLKINEKIQNHKSIAATFGNIGVIYMQLGNYQKSIQYLNLALKENKKISFKENISANYLNLGIVNLYIHNYSMALHYFLEAQKIDKELNNKWGEAINLGNIGYLYFKLYDTLNKMGDKVLAMKSQRKSLTYLFKALLLNKEIGNKEGIGVNMTNIGRIYLIQNKFAETEKYLLNAENILKEINNANHLMEVYKIKSDFYEKIRNFKDALYAYKEYIKFKDTLLNEENRKSLITKEMNYIYEKEKALREKEHQKQLAIEKEKQEKQRVTTRFSIFGLIFVLLFSFFIVNRLKITRDQKRIIENQKQIVEKQKKLVEEQKLIVEQKNKDITDSIKYAKRIQDAILPHPHKWKQYLPQSFVLYQPKDIVAGDFYWMEALDNFVFVAAADCTGHGVPGAMVSVVCSNALTKAVLEEKIINTDEILYRVREIVLEKLSSEDNIRDGMDICLIRLTKEINTVQFSGANRPLFIVSPVAEYVSGVSASANTGAATMELVEIKPDKQPIGRYEKMKPFTKQDVLLQKNSTLYLTTDGYADQFGGEKGKKIGTKAFKELLRENALFTDTNKQKEHLQLYFQNWKGKDEQLDDVTILGIRI